MTAKPHQTNMPSAADTGDDRLEKKPGVAPRDPATQRPVVRDLRFHRFVAHQREPFFLNQSHDDASQRTGRNEKGRL